MATYKKKIELKRVNMNLPATLAQRVEEYAMSMGLNTTNAYIVLINQGLDQKDTLNSLPLLLDFISKYSSIEKKED